MNRLMLFPTSVKRDPSIEAWMNVHSGVLGATAKCWFAAMRDCGETVHIVDDPTNAGTDVEVGAHNFSLKTEEGR